MVVTLFVSITEYISVVEEVLLIQFILNRSRLKMRASVKDNGVEYDEDDLLRIDLLFVYDYIFLWVKSQKILRNEEESTLC